jgi:hypothetical protein
MDVHVTLYSTKDKLVVTEIKLDEDRPPTAIIRYRPSDRRLKR